MACFVVAERQAKIIFNNLLIQQAGLFRYFVDFPVDEFLFKLVLTGNQHKI
jgi:hypothetical protein